VVGPAPTSTDHIERLRNPTDAAEGLPSLLARRWPAAATTALILEGVLVLGVLHRFTTRPFAFDEQWRATWLAMGPNIATRLHDVPGPMTAGWVGIEWVTMGVLPNTELSLRLPMLAALVGLGPVTFWLARRWVADGIAFATAALLLINGPMLVYGVLLKPFVFEAFCAVVMLWAWCWANGRSARARMWVYLGLGISTVFASSALFVLVALVGLDAFSRWREGDLLPRAWKGWAMWPDVTALAIAGIHFLAFLNRQDHLLQEKRLYPQNKPYWQDFFLPHGPAEAVGFLIDRLRPATTVLSASYLPPDDTDKYLALAVPPAPPSWLSVLLGVAFSALVVWGIWRASRNEQQRVLVVVLATTLAIVAVASFAETWPFGMVRANLFLVPVLYVLAAIGAHDLLRKGWAAWRSGKARARRAGGATLAGISLLSALAVPAAVRTIAELDRRYEAPQFVDRERDVMRIVRLGAGPDDLAIAVLNPDGWRFYANLYNDPALDATTVGRVEEDRTLLTDRFTDPAIPGFVAEHPDAQKVFVFDFAGIDPDGYEQQVRWLREQGFCPAHRWDFTQTGILVEFRRATGSAPCPPTEMHQPPPTD